MALTTVRTFENTAAMIVRKLNARMPTNTITHHNTVATGISMAERIEPNTSRIEAMKTEPRMNIKTAPTMRTKNTPSAARNIICAISDIIISNDKSKAAIPPYINNCSIGPLINNMEEKVKNSDSTLGWCFFS